MKIETKLDKIFAKVNKKYDWIFSALLSSVSMYLFMAYSQVLSTGKYCLLDGDLIEIYVPAIRQMVRNILNGESVYYSFTNSLGMNTAAYNASYATGSVFHIFYLIFYHVDPAIVTALVIILKTGAIGACFHLFYQGIFKESSARVMAFSVFYSMCSYNIFVNQINMIWMDALYILPLLLLSIHHLIRFGRWKGMTLVYCYLFIYNYYMAYMTGIISFVFFAAYLMSCHRKKKWKLFAVYAGSVCLAILLSAVVLLPTAAFLLENRAQDSTSLVWWNCNLLQVYNQLFLGQFNGMEGWYPYLYCGIPALLLLPFYFLLKKIRRQEKIISSVVLTVLILFTITPAGYLFIHAFDAPDGWGFRFSFVYSFLFCTMGCRISAQWKELKPFGIVLSGILNAAVYFGMIFWQNHRMQDWMYSSNTYKYALMNAAVLFLWTGYYFLCRKFGDDFKNRNAVIAMGLLLTVTESVCNGWLSYYKSPEFYPGVLEDNYFAWRDNLTDALDEIEAERDPETEFYRISTVNNLLYNSDTYMGYNGVSDFGTTENYKARKSLEKIGYYSSPRLMPEYGLSPVSAMLLGVKYEIDVLDIYQWNRMKDTPDIRKNDICLQVGFMVDADLEKFTFEDGDAFKNSNDLLSVMTGETIEVYAREDQVEIVEDGIHLRQGNQQLVLDGDGSKEEMTITYRIPADERPAYSQFYYGDSRLIAGMPYFYGGVENNILGDGHFGVSYIKAMEQDEEGYYVTIGMNQDSIQSVYYEQANFYYYNETELQKAYDILSENQWEPEKIRNGNLCGKIISTEEKQLMFIAVPYDKGWEAFVDGKKTTILPVMEEGFMAISLEEAGEHRIEIKYTVPGLMTGKMISMLSALIFTLLCFKTRKK